MIFFSERARGRHNIKLSKNLLIFSSETANLYEMIPEQYKTIITNKETKTQRKAERSS